MSANDTYDGGCFCGAVRLTVTGTPIGMGYCHCESCRHWSAGPVNAFCLWPPDAVKITQGAEHIGTYNKTRGTFRKWCKKCGGHILSDHPELGFTDVFAAITPGLAHQPTMHVNYGEKTVSIRDGLPKLKDFPKEMGGSGVLLEE